MKSSLTIFFFLFAIAFLAAQNHVAGFNYFLFQWPGSYCSEKHGCCYPKTGKPVRDFTIGGFWPNDLMNSRPKYCNNQTLLDVSSQIQDLKEKLDKNWPALKCPSSRSSAALWKREWLKYGTCSGYTQHEYFEAALAIKQNVDLLKILKNAGIDANGTSYRFGDVYKAIEEEVGHMPALFCSQDKLGNYRLLQVIMCGGSDGRIEDCPWLPTSTCADIIKFPSHPSNYE